MHTYSRTNIIRARLLYICIHNMHTLVVHACTRVHKSIVHLCTVAFPFRFVSFRDVIEKVYS